MSDQIPTYRWWKNCPPHLKSRAALARIKLKPPKEAKADAYIDIPNGLQRGTYEVFDVAKAVPKQATPAQLAALEKGRITQRTCPKCGTVKESKECLDISEWGGGKMCWDCEKKDAMNFFNQAYNESVTWARDLLNRSDWVILDTETTDLDGYIVEMGIIAPDGSVVVDTLLNPEFPISEGAMDIHGIKEADVATAPTFVQIEPQLRAAIEGKTVVVYNAAFDYSIIEREFDRAGGADWAETVNWDCAMEAYAAFYGQWNDRYNSFRWQRLNGGHRAVGDCHACLALIKQMAEAPLRELLP